MKTVLKETNDRWNPNHPLNVTHEEFIEHISGIEKEMESGNYLTIEEFMKKWKIWEKNHLKSIGEK